MALGEYIADVLQQIGAGAFAPRSIGGALPRGSLPRGGLPTSGLPASTLPTLGAGAFGGTLPKYDPFAVAGIPAGPARAAAYIAPEGYTAPVAPHDPTQPVPIGYAFVPVTELRKQERSALTGLTAGTKAQAAAPVEVRRRSPSDRPPEGERAARESRTPRPQRAARPARTPRAPRAARTNGKTRAPRRARVPRRPRAPRPPRAPRASKTKGTQVPGICRVQCGGGPGACWNTGVCISGLVPYPAHMGACCFPRTFQCAL
jgi:hypothetical protein